MLYDARCWGFRGLEHAICSNQTGREAPLIYPGAPGGGVQLYVYTGSRKAGKPKQYKLTDIRGPSVPSGVTETRGETDNLGT